MSTGKKILIGYLVVSSVILHGVVAVALWWLIPAWKMGVESAEQFAAASAGQAKNLGVVEDVSVLKEGENTYVGYAVDYKGQKLYVMGAPQEQFAKGDSVAVTITKHPYGPLKTLIVTVMKNGK